MKEYICIVCPKGCHINVDENGNISGYSCPRGLNYVKQESTDPKRTITSTVLITNRPHTVCPVKTSSSISKKLIFECMDEIKKVRIEAPIHIGDVILKNILNEGVDLVATKEIL